MTWDATLAQLGGLALHHLWLGLSICLVIALFLHFGKRFSAKMRHDIWVWTLAVLLFLPAAVLLPQNEENNPGPEVIHPSNQSLNLEDSRTHSPVQQANLLSSPEENATQAHIGKPLIVASQQPGQAALKPNTSLPSWRVKITKSQWLLAMAGLWLLGFLWQAVALGRAFCHLKSLRKACNPVQGPLAEWFAQAVAQNKIGRSVSLAASPHIAHPMAAGLWNPVVIFPVNMLHQLEPEEIREIVHHELAHIKRGDDWINLLQKIAEAVFFFHPAIRYVGQQLNLERELACDEWAAAISGDRRKYAYCLVKVCEQRQAIPSNALTVGAVLGKKQLTKRVEALLHQHPAHHKRLSPISLLGLTAIFACGFFAYAAATPKFELEKWWQNQEPADGEQARHQDTARGENHFVNNQQEPARPLPPSTPTAQTQPMRTATAVTIGQNSQKETGQELVRALQYQESQLAELESDLNQLQQQKQSTTKKLSSAQDAQKQALRKQLAAQTQQLGQLEKKYAQISRQITHTKNQYLSQQQNRLQRLQKEAKALQGRQYEQLKQSRKHQQELERVQAMELTALKEASQKIKQQLAREKRAAFLQKPGGSQSHFRIDQHEIEDGYELEITKQLSELNTQVTEVDSELSLSKHRSNSKTNLKFTYKGATYEMRIRGPVTFNTAGTAVTSVHVSGYFTLSEKRRKKTTLTLKPGPNGSLVTTFSVGGSERSEAEARQWLAAVLPMVLKETALEADARIREMIEKEGLGNSLDYVASVSSDYAKSRYLRAAALSGLLAGEDFAELAEIAASLKSDFEYSRTNRLILKEAPAQSGVIETVLHHGPSHPSNFEARRLMSAVLQNGGFQEDHIPQFMDWVAQLNSSFEKAKILRAYLEKNMPTSQFWRALATVNSNFENARVIKSFIRQNAIGDLDWQPLLQAIGNINSDFEKANLLLILARQNSVPVTHHALFKRTLAGVASNFERNRVEKVFRGE